MVQHAHRCDEEDETPRMGCASIQPLARLLNGEMTAETGHTPSGPSVGSGAAFRGSRICNRCRQSFQLSWGPGNTRSPTNPLSDSTTGRRRSHVTQARGLSCSKSPTTPTLPKLYMYSSWAHRFRAVSALTLAVQEAESSTWRLHASCDTTHQLTVGQLIGKPSTRVANPANCIPWQKYQTPIGGQVPA